MTFLPLDGPGLPARVGGKMEISRQQRQGSGARPVVGRPGDHVERSGPHRLAFEDGVVRLEIQIKRRKSPWNPSDLAPVLRGPGTHGGRPHAVELVRNPATQYLLVTDAQLGAKVEALRVKSGEELILSR